MSEVRERTAIEVIDAMDSTESVIERLERPSLLTPKPAYPMVCGTPVQGLYSRLVYRCECGVERPVVVPVVVGLQHHPEPTFCLNCHTFRSALTRLEFGSL